jgi:hypothetical protein
LAFSCWIAVGFFHAGAAVFLEFRTQQREVARMQLGLLAVLAAQQLAGNQR